MSLDNCNAGKRLLQKIGNEHPNLKLIVVEDGFASNAPHILQWKSLDMHFILGAKPDDHEHLFDEASQAEAAGRVTTLRWTDNTKKEAVQCEVRFAHNLPLNKSNADLLVNFLQYTEYASDGSLRKRFSWATDLRITRDNAHHLARGGRARWKIENETLNVRAEVEVLQRSVGGGIGSENTATYTYSIARHAARTSPLLSNLRIFQSEQLNPATGPTQGHLAGNCWL